ncbi:AAA family ATPase [Chryseobacterium jejuense]|uniref:AAA family ATPase n=1 Tax=Chryseobacterium jejuense TaxID=445960 RepID=UPI001AE69789|nr:AAA family ATPase [Chryseobacterium jejuense]MBP2617981.1 dephospho-CoA kinase [Chryseobacterium jejuense]
MKSIYITGMSGTGKSSVIQNLQKKGYTTIDTDYGDWKELSLSDGTSEWILKENKLKQLFMRPLTSPIFISGCCANQTNIYSLFDYIVLLSASVETILKRVADRTSNPYGTTLQERNEIIWNFENIQPLLQQNNDFEYNTEMMTVEEITTSLEVLIKD